MPCCKSTPSQIALSCTVLCIALCTVVIALSTLPSALLTNNDVYKCFSFYLEYIHLVTDVPLSASQLQLDSNTINLWGNVEFRYQRHINQTANSTWYMSFGYMDYMGSFVSNCDTDDIQGTVWFCVASDVPSASCLNASRAYYPNVYHDYDFGFGISLWDSSSNAFYYYIFDQIEFFGPEMPCSIQSIIYDRTTSLFDLWANHHNCESKTIALLFSFCFCGVQLIPIFVGCVCLFRCIIKYCKKKKRERLLRSYPNFDAVNRRQSQPPPYAPTQYQQRLPNTVNYPVAFIVTPTPYPHPSPPRSGNSYLPRCSVLQRIPYRILSITPDMINVQKLVVNGVASKWKEFAILLGFDQHLIDIIDCDTRSCQEGCREMFRKWLRVAGGTGSKERTWETIVNVVERMEDFSLAAELADNLCSLYR